MRYRKKVIITNLKNSFPDKTSKEIEAIASEFYQNLADIIVEVVKMRTLSAEDLKKRVKLNAELPIKYLQEKNKCHPAFYATPEVTPEALIESTLVFVDESQDLTCQQNINILV